MFVGQENYALPELVTRQAPTLLDVANVLREHGWCQGTLTDEQGRHCIVGAMGVVAHRYGMPVPHLAKMVVRHLAKQRDCILAWNDAPRRTKEEVIAMLEEAHANQNT